MFAQASLLYQTGLQIFAALNTILAPGSTDAQIAAAIRTVNGATTQYQNAMSNLYNALVPYFPHYNPRYVAAWKDWISNGVTRIDTALGPIILDGMQHGGHYDPAVIDAHRAEILTCMGDLNIFRNPANYPQLQASYVAAGVEMKEREELSAGDFDPAKIGLAAEGETA